MEETKLNSDSLMTVLVVDLLEKTASGIVKVSYEKRSKTITNGKALGVALRALSGLRVVLDKRKDEIDLTTLDAMDKKLRSEVYTTERIELSHDLLTELADIIKNIANELKIKYKLEQKSWYL